MYTTVFKPIGIFEHISGGGVNLRIFSLSFLWNEHQFFRNVWSTTNDGYDLAQYIGTKIYLQPHPFQDYIFWWDTDLTRYGQEDYLRLHPARLLGANHTIFVRSQKLGGNHKTKTVVIKPPANITSQWKFQADWFDFPLFAYGFTLINWPEPFYRQQSGFIPYVEFDINDIWYRDTSRAWVHPTTSNKFAYSPLVDNGVGNLVAIFWSSSAPASSDAPKPAYFTKDLPYWYSTFGQNISWDFGVEKTNLDIGQIMYAHFVFPYWTVAQIENPPDKKPKVTEFVVLANSMRKFATMGFFVQSNVPSGTRINIPFMYKSKWRWGGTMLKRQAITALYKPPTNQVSVKNPRLVGDNLIQPGDQKHGLLTDAALRRFLQPYQTALERVPEPFEERPPWYAYPEVYDETGSEAEETEEEFDPKADIQETLRNLTRGLQRERTQRISFNNFLKSLLK